MTQEGAVPPGLMEQVRQIAREEAAKVYRSAALNSSTISGGEGLTVGAGSKFKVRHPDGRQMLLAGVYDVNHNYDLADGSYQPMLLLSRADGTLAMSMYDPSPSSGGYQQFWAIWDRDQNIIFSDDTSSGQGHGRPNLPFTAYRSRNGDWPVVTSTSFTTVYRAKGLKQQPRLYVETWANCTDASSTAEVRVMVNSTQVGSTLTSTAGFVSGLNFGPVAVPGEYRDTLSIEIQYRLASGVGNVECGVGRIEGWQS